jgi:hypothetical protein
MIDDTGLSMIADRIRDYVDSDRAVERLRHYRQPGAFSGSAFETLAGAGDTPEVADEFTAADLVAITTLSVSVPGWGAIDLLD